MFKLPLRYRNYLCQPAFKCLTVWLILIVFTFSANGQTTLYSENFDALSTGEITTGGYQGWKTYVVTATASYWEIYPCSAPSSPNCLTMYDSYGTHCDYAWDDDGDEIAYYATKINAIAYSSLEIDFKWKCSGSDFDYGMVVFSTNGTTWNNVSATQYHSQSSWQTVTDLDLSAADGLEFYIGFRFINAGSGGADPCFSIDDIEVSGTASGSTCEHQIDLYDSYGDGWNGASVDVKVNGSTVLTDITVASGSGPASYTFDAADGDDIVIDGFVPGSYPTECYFDVIGGDESTLVNDWYPNTSGDWTGTNQGVCPSSCAAPSTVTAAADGSTTNISVCPGSSVDLTKDSDAGDGNVGSGTWEYAWYNGSNYWNGSTFGSGSAVYNNSYSSITTTVSSATTFTLYMRSSDCTGDVVSDGITVNMYTESTAASSATKSGDDGCPGTTVSLNKTGGSLGSGAAWKWYTGSCGGTLAGTGVPLDVNPTTTTTYYLRAEGTCNTTSCQSVTVTISNTESTAATTATKSGDASCPGETITLNITGGSLGTGATWEWYSGSCGGTSVGSGVPLDVNPSATTTYYVRAEGTCNTTSCQSVTVNVTNTESTAASSATKSGDDGCPGTTVSLNITGGSLGTGATWEWYSGSCGGTSAGSGVPLDVNPTTTTTYYVRAEGTCNTTTCQSVTVTISNTESTAATTATKSGDATCPGETITLNKTGGSLGTGATWEWYSGSCGGTYVGSGVPIDVNPTVTTTYYIRAEGTCNNTSCQSVTVNVNGTESTAAASATKSGDDGCSGTTVTLNITGGSLGTGATWEWYSGSCGGTSVGSGVPLDVNPTTTTTYYVRAEGTCNTTSCQSVTVTIKPTLYTVGPAQDYATIQAALDAVHTDWGTDAFNCGDVTVDVYSDTYSESVTVNTDLNPQSGNRLIIQAHSGESPVINAGTTGISVVDIDYVTIDGFEIKDGSSYGIDFRGNNGIIKNNVCHDNASQNIRVRGSTTGMEIYYNKCYGTAAIGIQVQYTDGADIHHNLCYNHTEYGIRLTNSADNATITNNTCYNNGSSSGGGSSSANNTYSSGDIGTEFGFDTPAESSTCPGSMSVTIPANATITSVDVEYDMIAHSGAYMSEQRSQLRCTSTGGTNEASVYSGSGSTEGTYNYSRNGLTIANSVTGGGAIDFEMHAGRTWGGSGCNTTYNYVDNNTLIITVYYNESPTYTGAGIYIASGASAVVTNNILVAKSGTGDQYYGLLSDVAVSTSSGYNTYYNNGNTYFVKHNGTSYSDSATWEGTSYGLLDVVSDPLFVTDGTDFHIQSASSSYHGGSWPPGTASGGTWTSDANDSPAIDAGNPADSYSNEPAGNGDRINQGCYGNTAQASKSNDKNSIAEDPATQVAANAISSIVDTDPEAQAVFSFKITDQGSSDGAATKVTQITVKPGTNNDADWTDHIQGVKLHDGTGWVTIGSETITDTDITIPITSGNLDVADNSSTTCTLYVYLNTGNIVDGAILDFRIDYDDHGFTADASGSTFASAFGAADIEGNNQTVVVTATELQFVTNEPPATVAISENFTVTVKATDENENIDVDESSQVTLAVYAPGTGNLSSGSGLSKHLTDDGLVSGTATGTYTWTDVQYNTQETFKIEAQSGSLTNGISIIINCIGKPGTFSITEPLDAAGCAGNVDVSWGASANADSYDLFYCEGASCSPTAGTEITGVTSTYVFNAANAGTVYRIMIRANNAAGGTWSDNIAVYATGETGSWSGAVSTAWNNAGNWCGGVPGTGTDVAIPSGVANYPTLDVAANVKDITIESGATLNASSYTLNVYGDWTNNGTFNAGTGTVTFKHATDDQDVDNGSSTFNNFTIDKAAGSVILQTNDMDVDGNVTITDGTLDAHGQDIYVAKNWSNSDNFIPGTGAVIFDGSANTDITRVRSSTETILSEDFEDGTTGWILGTLNGKSEWRRQTGGSHGGSWDCSVYDLGNGIGYDFYHPADNNNNHYIDLKRTMDFRDYSSVSIDYWWKCMGGGFADDRGMFLMDGDYIIEPISGSTTWQQVSGQSLNAYSNGIHDIVFRFVSRNAGGNPPGLCIDDLHVYGINNNQSFNKVRFEKTGGATVTLNTLSSLTAEDDFEIASGTFDANGKRLKFKGDFINNGTFTANDNSVVFMGSSTQTIKGSSNTTFYDFEKKTDAKLVVGDDATADILVHITNSFDWQDNDDQITVGNGQPATLKINDDLYIHQDCTLETGDDCIVNVSGHYTNYGDYIYNEGMVKFHGSSTSFILREPAMVIYSDGFEGGSTGWTLENNGSSSWSFAEGLAHNSTNDLAVTDESNNIPYDYLWSCSSGEVSAYKTIDLSGYTVASLTFYYRAGGDAGDYGQVLIDGDVVIDNLHGQMTWAKYNTIDISDYVGGSVELRFKWKWDADCDGIAPGLCIDDLLIASNSVNSQTFYDLTVNKSSDKVALRGPIDINNDMLISGGEFDCAGLDLPVGDDWTNESGTTFTHGDNTVTFDGNQESKSQEVDIGDQQFYNVVINNSSGTVSISNNILDIDNDLTITDGTLDANDQDIEIDGDWINNGGTFNPQTQTVHFIGTSDQSITSGSSPFYNVYMNKSQTLTLVDDITLNNDLKLTVGLFDVSANNRTVNIAGDWINAGGSFQYRQGLVNFNGSALQRANIMDDAGTVNSADFIYYDVTIDGTDVFFFYDSDNRKLTILNNLIINDTKKLTLDDE